MGLILYCLVGVVCVACADTLALSFQRIENKSVLKSC